MDSIARLNASLASRYTIEREIGAGGMAAVYLARDTRHDREVAIKVLHPELGAALGAERFLAEIKTTAKLQHPHILPLLDSGEADGLLFYVMPLMDGETLRSRLEREQQLPLDDAIRIADEMASALDYAHRHGVIHRDVKPENILLHDGRALVADFGIALAVSAASGPRMTQTGLSLGTPQYMAPEQAMGERSIDGRADVYALGAVLYEMLTGEPPFSGASVQAIVAKVLTERPMNPTAVRDTIPRHVEATVLKALAKLPADRFATPAQFADALKHPEIMSGVSSAATATGSPGAHRASRGIPRYVSATPAMWAVLAMTALVGAYGWIRQSRMTLQPSISVPLTDVGTVSATHNTNGVVSVSISSDGSRIAFAGRDSTRVQRVFVRSLSDGSVTAVPQSENGRVPVFSPDGQSLAFHHDGQIFIWSASSGSARPVTAAFTPRGMTWSPDSSIIYSAQAKLMRVRSSGGAPEVLAAPDDSSFFAFPHAVSADVVLFTIEDRQGHGELAVYFVRGKRVKHLGIQGSRPSYIDSGIITYVDGVGAILGVQVDPSTMTPRGAPRFVAEGSMNLGFGSSHAVSRNGVLVVQRGSVATERELLLVDRSGKSRLALGARRPYRLPRFSPNGPRIAVGVEGASGFTSGDVWIVNPEGGTIDRVTVDTLSSQPEWDPDGRTIVFVRRDHGSRTASLARIPVDGSGKPVTLLARPNPIWESHITPDRRTLVWREDATTVNRDIFFAALDSPTVAHPLRNSNFDERGFAISPDGKWIAYTSNEKGTAEVYICRIESNGPRWPVSRQGGSEPRWARTGELFFRNSDTVLVSRVELGPEPKIGAPTPLFTGAYAASSYEPLWDVSPDGKQFAMVRLPQGDNVRLQLMINWVDKWLAVGK